MQVAMMQVAMMTETQRSIRRHLLAGTIGVGILFLGLGGWAAMAEFSGAVVTAGTLVVESDVKKVQHLAGGIVSELRVRDGDRVTAGDVLLRLDQTVLQANRAIVSKAYDEAMTRKARLEAERDQRDVVTFPQEILERQHSPEVGGLVSAEIKLFETRRSARDGQKSQLQERVGQLHEQIQGVTDQIVAKRREIELITQELAGVRDLWDKKLIAIQRVTALERDLARIEGEKGSLVSSIAQSKGRITETKLQIIQIDQDLRNEVGKELADINSKLSEYVERKITSEDQLKRVDIRAPQDGFVHQLTVHTLGGVVAPGETIMMIVPSADHLTVETRIAPRDIDQVRRGQRAIVRFSGLNQRTTPELDGEVSRVSPDQTTDPKTGQSYYTTRIALSQGELSRLGDLKLTPGMPAEAFLQTQSRTILTYFTKSALDQIAHTFRER